MNPCSSSRSLLALAALTGLAGPASAALIIETWTSGFTNGGLIPDGNPVGWFDTRTLSGFSENFITDVNVSLTITGGYNGDLYAYLQHDSGIAILLNRPGRTATDAFGASTSGFSVTFDDSGANGDSHLNFTGGAILDGSSWQPDGRAANPATVVATDPRTNLLSSFEGFTPVGDWTLYVADLSGGDTTSSHVTSWSLSLTAVPEPCEVSALVLLVGSSLLIRNRPQRQKTTA